MYMLVYRAGRPWCPGDVISEWPNWPSDATAPLRRYSAYFQEREVNNRYEAQQQW